VRLMTEPDGNLVDLSREAGPIEFDLSPGFLDRLEGGEKVAIRLRTADQLETLARLAFGHRMGFEFRREGEGGKVVLFRERPLRYPVTEETGPVI
jgi:hypothetical protein